MNKVLIAPRKYVQGNGVLKEIGSYLAALGTKPMLLWDSVVKGIVGQTVLDSSAEAGLEIVDVDFQGDTTKPEAARVAGIIKDSGADIAVAELDPETAKIGFEFAPRAKKAAKKATKKAAKKTDDES